MSTDSSTEVRQAAELMALHARIEALEAALRDALNYIEASCDLHAVPINRKLRAVLDKDAGK